MTAKRGRAARANSRPLSLGDLERTGQQDCDNVISLDEFDTTPPPAALARAAGAEQALQDAATASVKATWKRWEEDGLKEEWLAEYADGTLENLDPQKAYRAWRDGWQGRAVAHVAEKMKRRAADERDNPGKRRRRANPDAEQRHGAIIDGIERALWVSAFAQWAEEQPPARRRELAPGAGKGWSDVAPATPGSATVGARQLARQIERANGDQPLVDLLAAAAAADRRRATDDAFLYAEAFGHALAMQALGTGVSWFDDHARFPLKVPRFEAWTSDGRCLEWSPRDWSNPWRLD